MLQVLGLRRLFGAVQALDDVSLTVRRGEVLGFLGPNGAGKSTTMRCVMGVIEPDSGDLLLDGVPLDAALRRRFGYMPEERGLYGRMRVKDHLVYLARLQGLDRAHAQANVDVWLDRLGLSERAETRVGELSHGNQQRAQLAAALVHDPDVLVLDEPFSGLDPLAVDNLAGILAERAAAGNAVLFSSHQLDLVQDLCRSVVLLNRGHLVLSGDVASLRRQSDRRVLRAAVEGSDGSWATLLPGADTPVRDGDAMRLSVPAALDPAVVLKAAQEAGRVVEFSLEPPRLSELFLDAVQAR